MRGNGAFVAGVAGKGKGRIRQQEYEAAMRNAVAVDHVRLHRHRKRGPAGFDVEDFHAETLAGVVVLPHRLGAGAREVVGRKHGPDG